MRIVHLADLHLGYRQYQRLTPAGINQREADVAASFTRAVDRVIEIAPDAIFIAGDFFHQVRPANPAILHAFTQMARLVRALPDAIVVVIAGNHDTPRTRDTVCILRLFTQLGVHVVDGEPRQLRFDDRSLAVLCVPETTQLSVALLPDPSARFNVLLAHAEVRGQLPEFEGRERASLVIEPEDVAHTGWDYVALGHYHVHHQVGPRAWYAGSLDYTSANPWAEKREEADQRIKGKGIVEFDLATHTRTFHPLAPSRAYIDLPRVDGAGLGATELDARVAAAVAKCPGGIDDKVVRLILGDVPRHVARDLNPRAIREFRRRALNFNLDARPPEATRVSASGAPGRGVRLADTLRDRLRDRPLDSDLDRTRFVVLGLEYLARVESDGAVAPGGGGVAP